MDSSANAGKAQQCKGLAQIGEVATAVGNAGEDSRLHEGFEFDLAVNGFDDVFDVFAVFLFLEFFGFLQHEFVEAGARKFSGCFAGALLGLQECLVELVDFFGFAFGFGAGHSKRARTRRAAASWVGFGFLFDTRGFDFLRRCAEVALDFTFFFLGNLSCGRCLCILRKFAKDC